MHIVYDMYLSSTYLPEFIATHVENILKTVIRTTDILLNDASDYNARIEFAWAATQALNASTFCGVEGNRYDTHFLEHTLSSEYNIAHGEGLAIMLPAWMKWQKDNLPERFSQFAKKVFDVDGIDTGIKAFTQWCSRIGAPVTFKEGKIPETDIPMLIEKLMVVARFWLGSEVYTVDMISRVLENAK